MKIQIGTSIYNVLEVNRIGNPLINFFTGDNTIGQIHLSGGGMQLKNKTILIKSTLKGKLKKHTLYHEIAHGLCFELSKRYKEFEKWNDNEKFIDIFASKLMTCFEIKEKK